jgi:hypothetical protein
MEPDETPITVLAGLRPADDELGPAFEPAADAGAELAPDFELGDAMAGGPNWTAPRIKSLLQAKGALVHGVLAVDKSSQEWLYTAADLDAIAPALARIMNRYPATRAAAAGGDELAVAVGFAGYAARSYSERRAAIALQAAGELAPAFAPEAPAQAPAPAPTPMQTADDFAGAGRTYAETLVEPEWPGEGEPPPITGRTR